MTGLFDRLKDDDSEGSEVVEERQVYEESEAESVETPSEDENRSELNEVQEHNDQMASSSNDIGISSLMDKRAK